MSVCIEKITEPFLAYPFSCFTEHPSTSFMHKIMGMIEEMWNKKEYKMVITIFYLIKTRDYDNSLYPEIRAIRENWWFRAMNENQLEETAAGSLIV